MRELNNEYLNELAESLTDLDFEDDPKGEYGPKVVIVEDGDWIDEGKYSYSTSVYHFTDDDVYVSVSNSRSGSYFTDYEYSDPEFYFVKPVTKTVTVTKYVGI